MSKKEYDDDDGRIVADMSGVEKPSAFGDWLPRKPKDRDEKPPTEQVEPVDKELRRAYVLSALLAGLAIGAVFAIGLGIAILIMWLVWW